MFTHPAAGPHELLQALYHVISTVEELPAYYDQFPDYEFAGLMHPTGGGGHDAMARLRESAVRLTEQVAIFDAYFNVRAERMAAALSTNHG